MSIGPEIMQTVQIPIWLVSITCITFLGVLAIALALAKYVGSQIVSSLNELARAFNNFKDEAPKRFVSHSHFEMKTNDLEKEITGINKRIDDVADMFRDGLKDHRESCPARM